MARVRESFGQFRSGLQWAARAERTLVDLDGPEARALRAKAAGWRTRLSHRLGRYAQTLDYAEVTIRLAGEAGDLMTLAQALELADASSLELGRPTTEGVRRALAIYEELGALRDQARVLNTLGVIHHCSGEWPQAMEAYAAAEQAYIGSGATWVSVGPAANRAEILADQGRLDDAAAGFERAMQVWRSVNAASLVAYGDYQLGRIAAREGREDEATRRLESAREHFEATGEVAETLVVDAFTAEARCFAGRYEEALALAGDALGRARAINGGSLMEPMLHRVRGVALLALGRHEEGETALREGLEAARARQAGHEIAFALRTLLEAGLAEDPIEEQDWREEMTILASGLGLQFV
jgi:tetratricopeptide (TPR) repeat protein